MDSGYLIVAEIKKKDYDKIAREIKSNEGIDSYETSVNESVSIYENGGRKQSVDNNEVGYRREDLSVLQVATTGNARKSSKSETRPDSRQGNRNKQEVKFSYTSPKDSQGNTLSKEQQEFFKDSKVRDKEGNLLVVYHGNAVNVICNRSIVCNQAEIIHANA